MRNTLYERDFYAWANEQASLLRAGRLCEADLENIAEEIESRARSEKREFVCRPKVLMVHLLKWRFQPMLWCKSWSSTIAVQRNDLADHLAENASLRDKLPEVLAAVYRKAIQTAVTETGFDSATFPSTCPWTYEQIMDAAFWPGDAAQETVA